MATHVTADSPLNIDQGDPDWRVFEKQVANLHAKLDAGSSEVHFDARLTGLSSGTPRQIDVLIQGELRKIPIKIAIECKRYGRKIDVGEMDQFIGKLQDLKVDKGVFIVHNGVTDAARQRAENATHPSVVLLEGFDPEVELEEILPDCPSPNCYWGSVRWTSTQQPAGGEDVHWGYCEDCGSLALRCRDCGEIDGADSGECFSCGATYELIPMDYQ